MNKKYLQDSLRSVGILNPNLSDVNMDGRDPILPSPFLIGEAGAAAIAAVGYGAAELYRLKTGFSQKISISVRNAAIAQRSHNYVRVIDGNNDPLWDPISGFYKTKDHRWIQFHCNFAHHKAGILSLLKCEDNPEVVSMATKHLLAEELEEKLCANGMTCAMVRSSDEWLAHKQHLAMKNLPLLEIIKTADSPIKLMPKGDRPLSGIKVLDLTRVIAGPICGRTFAEHGADVTLVSSPNLPYILPLVMDTGHGKSSIFLDLNKNNDSQALMDLAQDADIFCQSYRPGGLDAKGFSYEALKARNPSIIYVTFSAYSHLGPWADRHGYDSLVQSATGIAYEQGNRTKPQHLPAQALDYITGYLAAFGAMEALRRRAIYGGSYMVRVSLAQTAQWFKGLRRADNFADLKNPIREEIADLLVQRDTAFGRLEYLRPVVEMSKTMPYWEKAVVPLGST